MFAYAEQMQDVETSRHTNTHNSLRQEIVNKAANACLNVKHRIF